MSCCTCTCILYISCNKRGKVLDLSPLRAALPFLLCLHPTFFPSLLLFTPPSLLSPPSFSLHPLLFFTPAPHLPLPPPPLSLFSFPVHSTHLLLHTLVCLPIVTHVQPLPLLYYEYTHTCIHVAQHLRAAESCPCERPKLTESHQVRSRSGELLKLSALCFFYPNSDFIFSPP